MGDDVVVVRLGSLTGLRGERGAEDQGQSGGNDIGFFHEIVFELLC